MGQKEKPTGIWTSEETRSKTDSFDKLMNRTWYAIGGSKLFMNGKMEIFWEINMWKPGKEKQLGNSFTNHTLTQEIQKGRVGKKVDHGIWKGKVKKDKAGGTFAGLQPVMYSCCGLPFNVPMFAKWDFMNFPENDSFDGFWTYAAKMMGKWHILIFSLTPQPSDEVYNAEVARLKSECGVTMDIERMVYPKNFVAGTFHEESTNVDGGEPKLLRNNHRDVSV